MSGKPPAHENNATENAAAMGDQHDRISDAGSPQQGLAAPVIFTPAANGGGDFLNDAKLKPVSGRFEMIPDEDEHFLGERVDRKLAFMSCGPNTEILQDDETKERVFQAAAYGYRYLDRPHLAARNLKQLTTYQRRNIFPIEMGKLDAIVFTPWKVRPNKEGYWPDHEDLNELRNMLEARRYAAEGDYRQLRKAPPSIPFWGRDLYANGYVHTVNDFEILGVCFRREVEYFLARLSEVHQYDEEPFWENGPSFLGPSGDMLATGTPHASRKDRRAAKQAYAQTPTHSPPPLPTAPRKPARDIPPHMRATSHPQEDPRVSRHLLTRHRGREPAVTDNITAATPQQVKQEDEHVGGGFAPPNGMTGLFRRTVSPFHDPPRGSAPPTGGPSDSDPSDDDDPRGGGGGGFPPHRGGPRRNPPPHRRAPGGGPPDGGSYQGSVAARRGPPNPQEAHFDFKLKMEIVLTWDGNPDKLARWILRVNSIAKKSSTVRQQLGSVVPQRLMGDAETWYFSLPEYVREECETDWEEIRQQIGRYYMNRSWYEKARKQALAIRFRDTENARESPSQYFIRKRELLELVFSYSESELITEIMAGAPLAWKTILAFKSYQTTSELQNAIKTHEDDLLQMESFIGGARSNSHGQYSRDARPSSAAHIPYRARANQGLTGQSRHMPPPPFPKDDSNIDKKTPESVNARPCRHCGSGKHWDYSCKYARKGMKKVRAHLASGQVEADEILAQEEYESLYYDVLSDTDSEEEESDSGSDITLISQRTLSQLVNVPRIRNGQKVRLVQVTGNATITGYVPLDLYFETQGGVVKMNIEAYVVKGMTTPLILGNDFADQYSVSIVRENGETSVRFSAPSLTMKAHSSVSPTLLDEDGHAFLVAVGTPRVRDPSKKKTRLRRVKQRHARKARDSTVRAIGSVIIPPGSSHLVDVRVNFPADTNQMYVERSLHVVRNAEDVFGAPDTLVHRDKPAMHVANLSDTPVRITKGQALGTAHRPDDWLDRRQAYSCEQLQQMDVHAAMIRQLIGSQANSLGRTHSRVTRAEAVDLPLGSTTKRTEEDPLAEEPVEGGPKTAEAPPEDTPFAAFVRDIDISDELKGEQREQLLQVLIKNQAAFSLDGRLGTIKGSVCSIPLCDGAKEVSLPPFPGSPAKREVMDAQMDKWIELGVIEPSVSPWGAPAFIVYRNGKPRMVVDYRKLNELTIPDEFPLPRQEDIMHALSGAQWLSTMDALAGFTQTVIVEEDRAKTAFRTHRGLHQFRRMPFGLRNGPSIFQRIMQGVLAPYMWMFALVYIDDIVVYSLTLEEHIEHLDKVLRAVADAGVTLAPAKCHFAYRSLMLLGQKVSRLGLSTHQEKVKAITDLAAPRNVSELHTFLGMMVYFSAYIPFYAWLAAPLFDLLRKEKDWEWEEVHQEAFELCKQVLVQAPVRAHAMPGRPYRVYSDAYDYGLAAILQQVQLIAIKDLRGTRLYERLVRAHKAGEPTVPYKTVSRNGHPAPFD
ncbi:Retrovirus-related Pol polyprotein from transposon 297 [Trametes pubescens]|uniref:Retrovirus-related Pol polyprotein from transposon 297 n=1 Tax=Trametes pubescens TaxID=154538 RepID=A0A1M2VV33_TRAPU|nr:Retrovirus-related Pol polyprotein from transposon 297 [Trametes pubescens]